MIYPRIIFAAALAVPVLAVHAPALAESERPLMRDFIGLNTHTVQFNPELYSPVARLVRDYHPYDWDVEGDSSNPTTFPLARRHITWEDQSGKWRSFDGRPDWREIYSSWIEAGFEIDACIMFGAFGPDDWADLEADAYRYGREFAEFFGPSGENLVTSVEIGNEPVEYDEQSYRRLFEAMARGVRDGDPELLILTATTQAGEHDRWSKPVDIFRGLEELYDALNVHVYSLVTGWPTWERSHPEDPDIEYLRIVQRTIDWRNEHAPGKQVWITEFGYDSSTHPAPPEGTFSQFMDVSDETKAQWLIRSFLAFASMDVDRAYMYWFNDNDAPTFHASSGLTRFLRPKPAYWAMKHLYESLGDYRFSRAVERSAGEIYIYEFVHGEDENQRVWVAWSPTGDDRTEARQIELPGRFIRGERMPQHDGPQPSIEPTMFTLSESPVYFWFEME
jgi:hypothetical protein